MKVATWGSNDNYEGGTGTRTPANLTPVVGTLLGDNVEEVAAAYHFDALRQADGTVQTVGGGVNGELGDGTHRAYKPEPGDIGLEGIVKIAAGGAHGVALDAHGKPWTWGLVIGDGRPLGEGNGSPVPVALPFIWRDVFAGGANVFAIEPGGEVVAFGSNAQGQIGNGSRGDVLAPEAIGLVAKSIACGGTSRITGHAVFLLPDGTVAACGDNRGGQSGQPIAADPRGGAGLVLTPTLVPGLEGVSEVFAGYAASYALLSDGSLMAWGRLPTGPTPVPVKVLENVSTVAAATGCALAVVEGSVFGIGNNDSGQLGDGTRREDRPEWIEAQGLNGVASLAIGEADDATHVAALHNTELSTASRITARPVAGGLEAEWTFGATTAKPWQIKHRPAVPKAEWIHDGQRPPETRSTTVTGLEAGKPYEVFVQNGDFGWAIAHGTPT